MENNIQYIQLIKLVYDNQSNSLIMDKIKSQYINLLKNLTEANDMELNIFICQIDKITNYGQIIIAVSGDLLGDFEIIGSGTVIIEEKIIHNAKSVAHIEDIVVHPNFRGKSIATNIITRLKDYARLKSCYKVILNCKNEYISIYEKSGFNKTGNQMSCYFN
jgi:glucosamine-phosphate N-acetyltransferase